MSPIPQETIATLEGIPLSQHPGELRQLYAWLNEIRPIRVFVEIGSRYGGSFYAIARHLGAPLCAVSLDLPGADGHGDRTQACVARVASALEQDGYEVHQVVGDSHATDTLDHVRSILEGRPIDFLFVDGDHTTLGALQDLTLYEPLMRPGGIVGVHDVGEPYGVDAVDDPHMDTKALNILSDVNAAFTRIARGKRWAKTVYKWGIGAVWTGKNPEHEIQNAE